MYILFYRKYTPTIYSIPVILKQPSPEIVSQLSEYGPEIPIESFLDVGKELNE